MGASAWSYFGPYQPDLSLAFTQLQADVFARREFYAPDGVTFASIEELLDEAAEDGTHSILDMVRVSSDVAPPVPTMEERMRELGEAIMGSASTHYGTIYRMSDAELIECFDTTKPTREIIEAHAHEAARICSRGTGRWALVTGADAKGPPAEIYFAGVSGD